MCIQDCILILGYTGENKFNNSFRIWNWKNMKNEKHQAEETPYTLFIFFRIRDDLQAYGVLYSVNYIFQFSSSSCWKIFIEFIMQ